MIVIERGTVRRQADGTLAIEGWAFDGEGDAVDIDQLAKLVEAEIEAGRVVVEPAEGGAG